MKYDLTKNIKEAERELNSRPLRATTAELLLLQWELKDRYNDEPQPLRYGIYLDEILQRVSVPLEKYDLIAGRSVHRELSAEEEEIFQSYKSHKKRLATTMIDNGHIAYSWDDVATLGLVGLKKRAEDSLLRVEDDESRIFLSGAILVYNAIEKYLIRYSKKAAELGMNELSEVCKRAATESPRDFYTALQLLYTITFVQSSYVTANPTVTIGRLDRILLSLYRKGLEDGSLSEEKARALITDFYCKHNLNMGRGEHQVGDETNSTTFKRIYNFDAPQYLLLAGTDEKGNSAVNELTMLFSECIEPKFKNPVVVIRYYKGMNKEHPELWRLLCQKALASSSMMFYNDTDIINAYKEIGLPDADARKYGHFGCNWPTPGDNAAWMCNPPRAFHLRPDMPKEEKELLSVPYDRLRSSAPYGFVEDFMNILHRLAKEGADSIDDLYREFWSSVEGFLDFKLAHLSRELNARKKRPSSQLTYADCFLTEPMKQGKSFGAGASKYYYELQSVQGLGTLIDCFITVDELVFKKKMTTLSELTAATDANFEGYERLHALCLSVDKYGSDTELSNYHARRITETYVKLVQDKSRPYFEREGLFLEPCLQSDTWHLKWGRIFGATPDGRLAGKPFSHNTRPSAGACKNGLTGMLNSMLSIPFEHFMSGSLNVDLQKKDFEGEKGLAIFSALFASYFNNGGLHAQVSVNNADELIAAQNDPDSHRDLRVRVTGYSGIFTDICKDLQDDIIERTIKEG